MKEIIEGLKKAYEQKQYERQVQYFIQLGNYYFHEKQHPIYAIACYNFALGICQDVKKTSGFKVEDSIHLIEAGINETANKFLNSVGYKADYLSFFNLAKTHREELKNIRQRSQQYLHENLAIQETYKKVNEEIRAFIRNLIKECIDVFGEPPCKYAVVGLGSLARNEATTYSDLEFMILIEEVAENQISIIDCNQVEKNNKQYFRNLTNLLNIKIINLGETTPRMQDIKPLKWLLDRFADAPTVNGFGFDGQMEGGCHTPLGNAHLELPVEKTYELIHTPKEMAKLLDEENYEKNKYFITLLNAFVMIDGDGALLSEYQEEANRIVKKEPVSNTSVGKIGQATLEKERALVLLSEAVGKFWPKMGLHQADRHFFDAKYDLYRLPNMIIDQLILYFFEIKEDNSKLKKEIISTQEQENANDVWSRIALLKRKGILSEVGADNLDSVCSRIAKIRLDVSFKNKSKDGRFFSLNQLNDAELLEYLSIDLNELIKLYSTIISLYDAANHFIKTSNYNMLKRSSLIDSSNLMLGRIHYYLLNFDKAFAYLNTSVETQQKAIQDLQVDIKSPSEIECSERKAKKEKELIAAYVSLSDSYQWISECWNRKDDLNKSREYMLKAHDINQNKEFNSLLEQYCSREEKEDLKKSEELACQKLNFIHKTFEDPNMNLDELAMGWQKDIDALKFLSAMEAYYRNDYKKALELTKAVYKMISEKSSKFSIEALQIGDKLSSLYQLNQRFDEAIKNSFEILEIKKNQHGENHIELAETTYWLGTSLFFKGDLKDALPYIEKAFVIFSSFHDKDSIKLKMCNTFLRKIKADLKNEIACQNKQPDIKNSRNSSSFCPLWTKVATGVSSSWSWCSDCSKSNRIATRM